MLNTQENSYTPVIGINMLYTGFPDIRKEKGHMNDFYMVKHLYVEGILNAGGIPMLTPSIEKKDVLAKFVEKVDAFLFIGGPDYPSSLYDEEPHKKNASCFRERQDADLLLMKDVLAKEMPILGICAGAQMLNIALGGKLIQHLPNAEKHVDEQYHLAKICKNTMLSELLETNECEINSSHHQAVDPLYIGKDCKISAYADDGTIEAFELAKPPFRLGLQFHIERHRNEKFRESIFTAFIEKAKEYGCKQQKK